MNPIVPRRIALTLFLVATALPLTACQSEAGDDTAADDNALTSVSDNQVQEAQDTDLGNLNFDSLTPTGTKLMRSAHWWMAHQSEEPRYPRPRMCASNVSKVFFLSEITRYDQEGVRNLIADVTDKGATAFKMPGAKKDFIAKLNTINGSHIPAGTLIAGMSRTSSNPGDQHIGFIGHTDSEGIVWAYHNNWYRPENEKGQRKQFEGQEVMVSDTNLKKGFLRQWMATPWLKIDRDAKGAVTDVTYLLPGIDDMNPFNPGYQVTLAIPAEIKDELASGATASPPK